MIPSEYRPLVDKIIKKTGEGKVKWQKTSDSEKFLTEIGFNTVIVQRFNAFPEDEPCISFNVRNTMGESVDFFSAMISESDYLTMSDLFNAARRQALDIDNIINSMMRSLE